MTQQPDDRTERFEFPIPFDPFRLLLALMEKWKQIVLFGILAAAAGVAYAVFMLGDTYTARIELLKQPTSGHSGDDPSKPYAPIPIDDETFLSAAYAAPVFDIAAQSEPMAGRISAGEIRGSVAIEQVSGLGLFAVTAQTKRSREDAYKIGFAYANAVIEHTANIRRIRAKEKSEMLDKELAVKRPAVAKAEKELLDFETKTGLFDEKAQVSTLINNLTNLKLKLEETRTNLESKTVQQRGFVRRLKGPRKLNELILEKTEELRLLRIDKTEEHPNIKRALAQLRDLKEQLAEAEIAARSSGTDIASIESGNHDGLLLQEIYRLEDDRQSLENLYTSYQEQIDATQASIDALPENVAKLAELEQRVTEMRRTTAMTEERKREADFHTLNAPGVVSVFQMISPDDVGKRSRFFKAFLLGIGGAFLGTVLAIGWQLLREFFRRNVRTPIQAAIATETAPVLHYDSETGPHSGNLRGFWLRNVARFTPDEQRFLFATLGNVAAEEAFWHDLFNVVGDGENRVLFMDCSERPLELMHNDQPLLPYNYKKPAPVSSIDPRGYSLDTFKKLLRTLPERHVLLMRWDTSSSSSLVEFRDLFDRYYFVTSTGDSLLRDVEESSRNYREVLGHSAGVVLVETKLPKFAKQFMDVVQKWFIDFRQKRKPATLEPAI